MTLLAFLLKQPEPRELMIEGHNFVYAGVVLLLVGVIKAVFGRKIPLVRSYWLWALFGGGVCLVVLGIWVGEDRPGYMELFSAI
jgi:protein-S-isoprenylcysteine O-methyltransferase Ste14